MLVSMQFVKLLKTCSFTHVSALSDGTAVGPRLSGRSALDLVLQRPCITNASGLHAVRAQSGYSPGTVRATVRVQSVFVIYNHLAHLRLKRIRIKISKSFNNGITPNSVNYKPRLYSDCNPDCTPTVPRLCPDCASCLPAKAGSN